MGAVTVNFVAYRVLTISGTVTVGESGLDGVALTVYGLRNTGGMLELGTTETVDGGAYSLAVTILDDVDQLRVQPSLAGYSFTPAWRVTDVLRNATCDFVALRTYSITGNIKQGGVGVPGVQLFCGRRTFSCGPQGGFTWGGFPPGTHTITPRAAGLTFTPTARNVIVADSNVFGCNFTAEGQPTRALRVTIRDTAGRGVANVLVRVTVVENGAYYVLTGTTGADGVRLFALPDDAVPFLVQIESTALYWLYPNPLVITDQGEGAYPRWTCTAWVKQAHLVSGYVRGMDGGVLPGIVFRVRTAEGHYNDFGSDADGYFITAVPLNTTLALSLVTPGYAIVNAGFPVGPVTANTYGCTIIITGVAELYGQVTDANGVGLEGASVYGESVQVFSGPGGWYYLKGVPGGWGSYGCYLPGYEFTIARVNVVGTTRYDFVATGAPSGYAISGTIEDSSSDPVPDVWVRVVGTGLAAKTDAQGYYVIHGLSNGEYVLSPDKPGWAFDPATPTVVIADADELQDFTAALATPVYRITGTVAIEGGGTLGGALVTETVTGTQALTASDGAYTLSGLPNGTYRLNIAKPGWSFNPPTPTVVIEDDDAVQDFTATILPGLLTISGQVLYNAAGLEGVRFYAGGFFYYSEADGEFELTGLSPGLYSVTPQLAGYTFEPASVSIELADVDVTDLLFTASRSFTLSGRVTLRGAGLAGVTLNLNGQLVTTDSAGNWVCGGLESGVAYTIVPARAGYVFSPAYRTVTIQDADAGGLDFAATEETDTTAPVVHIIAPGNNAEITGPVTVEWTATDNQGVAETRVCLDDNLQATLPGALSSEYAWTWNPSGWSNSEHTIRVEAEDAAGNIGSDEITIQVSRSLATSTRYLFSEQVGVEGSPNAAQFSGQNLGLAMFVAAGEELPANPAERYNVTVGVHVPGNVDFGDGSEAALAAAFGGFQVVTPGTSFAPLVAGSSWRLGLCAQPQVVWSFWEQADYARLTRILPLPSGDLALLAEPAALLWLCNGRLSLWEDLLSPPAPGAGESVSLVSFPALWRETVTVEGGSTAPVTPSVSDLCYYDGKVLLAAGGYLLAKDLDTGDLTIALSLAGIVSMDAVAAGQGGVYVATWDGTTASLYSFTWASTRKICDLAARAACLLPVAGTCLIGARNGRLYLLSGSAASQVYDTGEASVNRLVQDGTVTWALTGDGGRLYRSRPGWQLDNTFATANLRGAAVLGDDMYLVGGDNRVWRYSAEAWADWTDLEGVTALWDAYSDGTALYLAAEHSSGARLYRLEIAEPGGFTCGPNPPDCVLAALRHG